MNELLIVLAIAGFARLLTSLDAPLAEKFEIPNRVVSAALQFAAGIITALVAFTLMPPAVRMGPPVWIVLAFFVGGAPRVRPARARWACTSAFWSTW